MSDLNRETVPQRDPLVKAWRNFDIAFACLIKSADSTKQAAAASLELWRDFMVTYSSHRAQVVQEMRSLQLELKDIKTELAQLKPKSRRKKEVEDESK
jgi:hypothetical protein